MRSYGFNDTVEVGDKKIRHQGAPGIHKRKGGKFVVVQKDGDAKRFRSAGSLEDAFKIQNGEAIDDEPDEADEADEGGVQLEFHEDLNGAEPDGAGGGDEPDEADEADEHDEPDEAGGGDEPDEAEANADESAGSAAEPHNGR